ncbi:hypothetical protein M0804_012085 [Polistes exclamans]|nr:hypothetical protein M0804_012085 [Polistes exclamans]
MEETSYVPVGKVLGFRSNDGVSAVQPVVVIFQSPFRATGALDNGPISWRCIATCDYQRVPCSPIGSVVEWLEGLRGQQEEEEEEEDEEEEEVGGDGDEEVVGDAGSRWIKGEIEGKVVNVPEGWVEVWNKPGFRLFYAGAIGDGDAAAAADAAAAIRKSSPRPIKELYYSSVAGTRDREINVTSIKHSMCSPM